MKNKKLNLILLIVLMLIVTGCASKEVNKTTDENKNTSKKLFDVSYYGDITVGNITFDMSSTAEKMKERGFVGNKLHLLVYIDENTNSTIHYEITDFDDSYEITFITHSSMYQELGCDGCDYSLSTNVKLPKGISYDSTIDDVISAYGTPNTNILSNDGSYNYENNTLTGEKFGSIDCYYVEYWINNSPTSKYHLNLYFNKDTQKLYKVEYILRTDK